MERKLSQADDDCIFKGGKELKIRKNVFVMRDSDPGAAKDALAVVEGLEGKGQPVHGGITE